MNIIIQTTLLLPLIFVCAINVPLASSAEDGEEKVIMCFWGVKAFYTRSHETFPGYSTEGKFTDKEIDPFLCTHLIYTFAGMHKDSFKINTLDPNLDLEPGELEPYPEDPANDKGEQGMLKKAVALRDDEGGNKDLKILISIGGPDQASRKFSDMVHRLSNRETFINSIAEFILKHKLDGVEMHWMYPTLNGGFPDDYEYYPTFLKELREKLNAIGASAGRKMYLTAAFAGLKATIDAAYDIPEISKHIDYFNLMTFDFKMFNAGSAATRQIWHHSPLIPRETDTAANKQLTVQWVVDYFIEKGAPSTKLVLAIPAYARSYTMSQRLRHNLGDPSIGAGAAFAFTFTVGYQAYYEMCLELQQDGQLPRWEFHVSHDYRIPFAFNDNKWIGYDDEISAQDKVDFANERSLGGVILWSLEQDDFNNYCEGWTKFPILSAINDRMEYHKSRNL